MQWSTARGKPAKTCSVSRLEDEMRTGHYDNHQRNHHHHHHHRSQQLTYNKIQFSCPLYVFFSILFYMSLPANRPTKPIIDIEAHNLPTLIPNTAPPSLWYSCRILPPSRQLTSTPNSSSWMNRCRMTFSLKPCGLYLGHLSLPSITTNQQPTTLPRPPLVLPSDRSIVTAWRIWILCLLISGCRLRS